MELSDGQKYAIVFLGSLAVAGVVLSTLVFPFWNFIREDIIEEVAGVYPRIMTNGDMDAGAWSCGMVAGLINDIPTVKDLIDEIMTEADSIINQRLTGLY